MTRRPRRNHSPTFKAKVALAAIKVEKTLADRCMQLRSPLYVGQTEALQTRVKQHLQPSSSLSTRLRSTTIELDRCVLTYRRMPDLEIFHRPAVLQLTEEIVTRILRPGYVARIG